MIKHLCIKPGCDNTYEDEDVDRYYCPTCNEARKALAAEIDKRIGAQPRERGMSELEIFEAEAKSFTTPNGRTITFGRATL